MRNWVVIIEANEDLRNLLAEMISDTFPVVIAETTEEGLAQVVRLGMELRAVIVDDYDVTPHEFSDLLRLVPSPKDRLILFYGHPDSLKRAVLHGLHAIDKPNGVDVLKQLLQDYHLS